MDNYKKVIAIDFDGCICTAAWPEIGEPNWDVINRAKAEKDAGAELILWTCREGELLEAALKACYSWGLTFDAVNDNTPRMVELYGKNPRKVSAAEYWDDHAVTMPEKTRWISVKERLPEIGTPVLLRTTYTESLKEEEITIGALNSHRAGGKRKGEPFWVWIGYWLNDTASSFEFFLKCEELCPGNEYVTHWMPLPGLPGEQEHFADASKMSDEICKECSLDDLWDKIAENTNKANGYDVP